VAVCQTTLTQEKLIFLVELIRRRHPGLEVVDTRCKPVRSQQEAVNELAAWVDAMIVVGGLEASNTSNLARIARRHLPDRTHHIDRADRIERAWLAGIAHLGIAAGTSTPRSQIQEVVDRIASIASADVTVRWDGSGTDANERTDDEGAIRVVAAPGPREVGTR
jgi:4-hydroxy-3-methylbut-2-enyl diphosphate reductase